MDSNSKHKKYITQNEKIYLVIKKFGVLLEDVKNPSRATTAKIDRILSVILIISIILAIAMTVYVIVTPKQGEKFTEFYILGPNGTADDYPTDLTVGEEGEVIIGIVNHEYSNMTYWLEVRVNETVISGEEVSLKHNETWERAFVFKMIRKGDNQKLNFLLYKDHPGNETEEAYRSLHLWVDVS